MDAEKSKELNEKAKRYVDRYCKTYHVTPKVALTHYLVREVLAAYEAEYDGLG